MARLLTWEKRVRFKKANHCNERGSGVFRRHTVSKGIICDGSWYARCNSWSQRSPGYKAQP